MSKVDDIKVIAEGLGSLAMLAKLIIGIIMATVFTAVGLTLFVIAQEGYWKQRLNAPVRVLLGAAGLLIIFIRPLSQYVLS